MRPRQFTMCRRYAHSSKAKAICCTTRKAIPCVRFLAPNTNPRVIEGAEFYR